LVSLWPAKPNLPINFALAVIAGLLIGLTHIYLISESEESVVLDETVINWPSSEAIEDYVTEPENPTETAEPVEIAEVMEQVENSFVPQSLATESVLDGQDITENLSRGGNIDNIFR